MKKIGISCVFSNPQHAKTTPRGLELIYLRELFQSKGFEVIIFGNKCRTNKDLDFFLDITEVVNHDLEFMILQLAPANFFGGQYSDYSVNAIEAIGGMHKEGLPVFILPTDPNIKPVNPAKIFSDRFKILSEWVGTWDDIMTKSKYIFPGKSIEKFYGENIETGGTVKLDWFAYIFSKGVEISNFVDTEDKEFDVIYYGDKRGSYRNNKLKKYMPESTNNLLLGYKEPKIEATFKKKVKHSDLFEVIDKCKVSIVVGDKGHEDNVATFRFYESLASSALAAIDISYDPNKELIEDEVLKEILYIENSSDIEKLVGLYSEELIERQQNELKRILNKL